MSEPRVVNFERRTRPSQPVEVCPFSELEIRTCEVWIISLIWARGLLPVRMQLEPLRMKGILREMALERLHARAQGKPQPDIVFPEPKW